MVVFRLQKAEYAQTRKDILSGEGARRFGGRWNTVGVSLVYTSATPELAHSEFMIHQRFLPPPSCNLVMLQIPDENITKIDTGSLPEGWRSYQNYGITQKTTKNWLNQQSSLVLQVPSAIVPMSYNYLINPLHPDLENVNIIQTEPFIFDERFLIESPTNFMSTLFNDMIKE